MIVCVSIEFPLFLSNDWLTDWLIQIPIVLQKNFSRKIFNKINTNTSVCIFTLPNFICHIWLSVDIKLSTWCHWNSTSGVCRWSQSFENIIEHFCIYLICNEIAMASFKRVIDFHVQTKNHLIEAIQFFRNIYCIEHCRWLWISLWKKLPIPNIKSKKQPHQNPFHWINQLLRVFKNKIN